MTSDPGFTAAADQLARAMQDVVMVATILRKSLHEAGLTRRQARRVIETWVTHELLKARDTT